MGILGKITDALGALFGGVDDLVTSDEERLALKQRVAETVAPILSQAQEYEVRLLEARSRIIEAEAKSDSWLAANWRPFTMVVFNCYIIVAVIVGAEIPARMWDAYMIGLGGYMVGRSVEKTAGNLAKRAMDDK